MSVLAVDSARAIAELRELARLTENREGAQRLAWTPVWQSAREWLDSLLEPLPVQVSTDVAGNRWATLSGESESAVVIGSHLDSVPAGGWLDGALGILAGLEVLRSLASRGTPALTVKLVDWADEEGARFGASTFGSSAVAGTLDIDAVRHLRDAAGNRLEDVVAQYGVNLTRLSEARNGLVGAQAYLELHIEQGPVLERLERPLAGVAGTFGVERHLVRFRGQAAHAGSTPMEDRHDALAAAARLALEVRDQARELETVATVGRFVALPGIPTAVAQEVELSLDQRHVDSRELTRMVQAASAAAARIGEQEGVEVESERIWGIEPIVFDEGLLTLVDQAIAELTGSSYRMVSGPLHDAAQVARAGTPAAMIFVRSLRGLSHTKDEDSLETDLRLAVQALGDVIGRLLSTP